MTTKSISISIFIGIILMCLLGSVSYGQIQSSSPKYEMRGVWVASVANIDWPSKPGLSKKVQQDEVDAIIKHCKQLGLNAIFLQVRPASDVLYKSAYEPWSKVLTGLTGKSPKYDPLQYWIDEAHKNAIELHAWINPYRASMNLTDDLPEEHPYHQNPDMFVEYGTKLYYNPGNPKSNIHINKVVKELVDNYNIDGIHMDDYFYPYPIYGKTFPDSSYFEKYGKDEFDDINAWRRENVNSTIRSLRSTIKESKPWLQFGISPFGVWRNKSDDPRGSDSKAGTTNYDGLHADILLWMEKQWIDYVVPQLYWGTSHPVANYTILSEWWNQNHFDVPIYIGHGIYKIGNDKPDWQSKEQVPNQLRNVRESANLNGSVYFSYKHFKRDLMGLQDSLRNHYYQTKAIVPHVDANNNAVTDNEVIKLKANSKRIKWKTKTNSDPTQLKYIIYMYSAMDAFSSEKPEFIFDVTRSSRYRLPKKVSEFKKEYLVRVAVLNAYNAEGAVSRPVKIEY